MSTSRIADELAITRAIQLVARAYDHKRHAELLPKVFEENARQHYYFLGQFVDFSMPGGVEVAAFYHERCYATQHVNSPPVIEFEGDDLARTTTTVHAKPEGWRIRERTALGRSSRCGHTVYYGK